MMPRGDRTGPMGTGARSGRAAGNCAGYDGPGYANTATFGGAGAGMGMGRVRGGWGCCTAGGRGWRNRFFATGLPYAFTPPGYPSADHSQVVEMEKTHLKNRAQILQSELDVINRRLADMSPGESHDSL